MPQIYNISGFVIFCLVQIESTNYSWYVHLLNGKSPARRQRGTFSQVS